MLPIPLFLLACLSPSLGVAQEPAPPAQAAPAAESAPAQNSEASKPAFDYTTLRDSDEDWWADIHGAPVKMQDALTLALGTFETGETRARLARFIREEPFRYAFEIFHFEEGGTRRYDVIVSATEPKILAKNELAPGPAEGIRKADTQLPAVIGVVESKLSEEGGDVRVSQISFQMAEKPSYQVEVFHFDTEADMPRRYEIQVNGLRPKIVRKVLVDRFPGEPLRKHKAELLPSGLWIHDFETGDGAEISKSSKVKVNYRLWLLDNTKLKDTWKSKAPEVFLVENAPLPGMAEGMVGMRVGGRRKIVMPHTLGFGESNQRVPPKAMVCVDVEVVSLEE